MGATKIRRQGRCPLAELISILRRVKIAENKCRCRCQHVVVGAKIRSGGWHLVAVVAVDLSPVWGSCGCQRRRGNELLGYGHCRESGRVAAGQAWAAWVSSKSVWGVGSIVSKIHWQGWCQKGRSSNHGVDTRRPWLERGGVGDSVFSSGAVTCVDTPTSGSGRVEL